MIEDQKHSLKRTSSLKKRTIEMFTNKDAHQRLVDQLVDKRQTEVNVCMYVCMHAGIHMYMTYSIRHT